MRLKLPSRLKLCVCVRTLLGGPIKGLKYTVNLRGSFVSVRSPQMGSYLALFFFQENLGKSLDLMHLANFSSLDRNG